MCMLCVVNPGVIPDRDKLENSALNNPHGFGFAIVVPDEERIIVERTMDADESINNFLNLRKKYMDGYALWHARYATHGSKTVANCHPFKVGKDKRTYLAHNGIIDIPMDDKDDRSDTRVFAEDFLPAIGGVTALDNDLVWDMAQRYTNGSKVAILTVHPDAKHQLYLLHANKGEEIEGVWWSNDGYCLPRYTTTKSSYPYGYGDWWDDEYNSYPYGSTVGYDKTATRVDSTKIKESVKQKATALATAASVGKDSVSISCFNCASDITLKQLENYNETCLYCGACFDCESTAEECMCYSSYKQIPIGY